MAQTAAIAATSSIPYGLPAQETMRTRAIPGTREELPVVGLGAPRIFIRWPDEGKELSRSVVQTMVDLGGRVIDAPAFFDTRPPVLGELLEEMRLQQELFLTGKITVGGKEEGIAHLERTEQIYNKRPMDLLLIHNMREMATHWPTLRAWQDAGRARYIGVSRTRQRSYDALETFMKAEHPDFIMTGYSMYHADAAERILPLAADLGIGVIGVEPFKTWEDGAFFELVAGKELPAWAAEFDCDSWAQFSLKYILSHPAVTCVVTETSQVRHAADNMGAGYGRLPDAKMRQRMRAHVLSL